jgi:DNA-binding NtrC family response regulator
MTYVQKSAHADGLKDILLVEDSASQAQVFQAYLKDGSYRVHHRADGESALQYLEKAHPALIILDLGLPGISGLGVLEEIKNRKIACPVVIVTDQDTLNNTVEALLSGATDFLAKPITAERLRVTVQNILRQEDLKRLVDCYQDTFDRSNFHKFVGKSFAMQGVYQTISSVANSKAPVFITGESGTGKELCAEALHAEGDRCDGRFVALNCAAIPSELMESEIFGHTKGAFTGATSSREGAAMRADGGTLFLDEICEMEPSLQAKLLRFIQTGSFQAVGSNEIKTVNIRFVCATNRDPLQEVRAGRFREDLYYRLHVVPIHLPSLRERDEDINLIARSFLKQYAAEEDKHFTRMSAGVEEAFIKYAWPGNVRELQNTVRNAVILNSGETLSQEMLPPRILNGSIADTSSEQALSKESIPVTKVSETSINDPAIRPLHEVEREYIERCIASCEGSIPRAAEALAVSPSTVYRKIQQWAR